jgi:hypothetical protein
MKWNPTPMVKIYEALGAVADERVEVQGTNAKVFSSSGNKFYDISYDPGANAIMSNDNSSYWKGYLGYPAIAFLMKKGVLSYDASIAKILKGVAWKDINQKFKNDFEKALEYILSGKTDEERGLVHEFVKTVDKELHTLNLNYLGKRKKPPVGY